MKFVHIENNLTLLLEFKAGSEKAFDRVFTCYYPMLCVFANRILGNQEVGQDVVQESFIHAWNRRSDFDSMSKVKSFLYTCVRNACFKQLEKEKVKSKYESFLGTDEAFDDQDILRDIIHAEVISRIFAQVDTLPEQCRRVIYMTFHEDKRPKEIAAELGITISTVNSQKMRGLHLLRRSLSGSEYTLITLVIFPFICQ